MKKEGTQASAKPLAKKVARVARAKPRAEEPQAEAAEDVSPEQRTAGQRLINMIRVEVINQSLPERHPADLMGITPVYWNSLANGHRPIARLPKEKLQRLAEFLGVPLIQIYILSGHFQPEDFIIMQQHEAELDMMVENMRRHPKWVALAPTVEEWASFPMRMKLLVASLFEQVVHKSFLAHAKMEHAGPASE